MKKIILPALAGTALMALGACSEAQAPEAPAASDSNDPAMAAPAQERVPMTSDTSTTTETPERITIDKNGVSANINDDDATVSVDTKNGTSATIDTK